MHIYLIKKKEEKKTYKKVDINLPQKTLRFDFFIYLKPKGTELSERYRHLARRVTELNGYNYYYIIVLVPTCSEGRLVSIYHGGTIF